MTTHQDEQLLRQIAARNWIILALFGAGSLLWQSTPVTIGIISGGLVAITAYHWRYRALKKMLAAPGHGSARSFQIGYLVRLVFIGCAIYLLIVRFKVHPLALAIGLSIVVVNILWATLKRTL